MSTEKLRLIARIAALALAGAILLLARPAWVADKGKAAPSEAPAGAAADKGKAAPSEPAGGASHEPAAYPVVVVSPKSRDFKQIVRGYGTVLADVQSGRMVASATAVEVRAVEVLPGQRVRAGQALFTVAPDPTAFLAYQQASSALTLARGELARLKIQFADRLATATQLETAEKAVLDAEAQVAAARRQQAGAELQVLHAPSNGIVTAISVAVGDRPAAGTVLATIAPGAALRATVGVEPGEQRLIHVGDKVTVKPAQTGLAARNGRVLMVGAAVIPETHLVPVTVSLDASKDEYPSGLFVEASIEAASVAAFSLPRTALVKDEEGVAVFEVVDGKAHRVPVVLVADEGSRVGVTGELDPGRPVVTTGAYELEDGVSVLERKP